LPAATLGDGGLKTLERNLSQGADLRQLGPQAGFRLGHSRSRQLARAIGELLDAEHALGTDDHAGRRDVDDTVGGLVVTVVVIIVIVVVIVRAARRSSMRAFRRWTGDHQADEQTD